MNDATSTTTRTTNANAVPVPSEDIVHVKDIVERKGIGGAAALLELSRPTVVRVLAGLPMQRATVSHLRAKLRELTAPHSEASAA